MRILHLSAGRMFGGVETLQVTLARLRHLCPAMEQEFAVCYGGRFAEELRDVGVRVEMLPAPRLSRPLKVIRSRNKLAELLAKREYNLVITHMPWAQAVFGTTLASMKVPGVLWIHGAWQNGILEFLASRLPAKMTLANSRYTVASLAGPLARVPSGVVFPPVEGPQTCDARVSVRSELSTARDTVVIVQVSRLDPCKGHVTLLDALGALRELSGWVCWIVGGAQLRDEAEYFDQLVRRSKELGIGDRVRFVGQRRDVWRILYAADMYCQPNTGPEGFGISFVEALYAGLPVITSEIGAAPEVVNSTCGVLTRPGDAEGVARILRRLVVDSGERERLGRAAPRRARELCDPATQMKRFHQVLLQALN